MDNKNATNKWLIFFFAAIGIFMSTLDGSIVNIALPSIMTDMKVQMSQVSWIVMIYLLTVTSLLLTFGRISDITGRRFIYAGGLLVFSLGSLFCGISTGILHIIISRAFQGIGAAMIMTSTPALIADTFTIKERGFALGMMGTIVAGGLTAGPPIGGFILTHFSWRLIFFINIPIGLSAFTAIILLFKNKGTEKKSNEPFDFGGSLLITSFAVSFLLVITNLTKWGFGSYKSIIVSTTSLLSLFFLIFYEKNKEFPLLDLALFKIRLFAFPVISAVMVFASLFTMVFLMPFYLMMPAGYSAKAAGFFMVIPFMMLFVISPVSGYISSKIGSRILCTIGLFIMSIALYKLSIIEINSDIWTIAIPLSLTGIGTAMFLPPNTAAALSAVPADKRGISSGIIAAARNFGMVTGVAMAGAVFNYKFSLLSGGQNLASYTKELQVPFMLSFKTAISAGAITAITGSVMAFFRGSEQ